MTYRALADTRTAEYTRTLKNIGKKPLRHEFVPRLSSDFFKHELEATGYLQVLDFVPSYRFEARP